MRKLTLKITLLSLLLIFVYGCKKEIFIADIITTKEGTASHNNGFPEDYEMVFNQTKVNKLEIVFTAEEWQAMQSDLKSIPQGENPSYFHCEVNFNGLTWENVGIRYKGNSSLRARSGRLPLRFKFDKWEDQFPEIMDQRFYGFKDLSLSSNYNDGALMREKSACDVFRNFGVPAVQSAFYEIYIDKGTGTYEYFGVYSVLEMVDDTFLKDWFGTKSGNCYKPDGTGAKFSTSGFDISHFELKTNEEIADRSDIQEMYDALHSTLRTSSPAQWRSELEAVFDVNGFLKYLAANNTVQNWDTYGKMTHNYYLYHDPSDDLIKWIVWDNNEAFQNGKMGGAVSIGMTEVSTDWPLINYLIADDTYETAYKGHINDFITTSFESSRMSGIYSSQETLLYNSAAAEQTGYTYLNGAAGFSNAVSTLKSHNTSRVSAASAYAN